MKTKGLIFTLVQKSAKKRKRMRRRMIVKELRNAAVPRAKKEKFRPVKPSGMQELHHVTGVCGSAGIDAEDHDPCYHEIHYLSSNK
jgi:hypothetical protein